MADPEGVEEDLFADLYGSLSLFFPLSRHRICLVFLLTVDVTQLRCG